MFLRRPVLSTIVLLTSVAAFSETQHSRLYQLDQTAAAEKHGSNVLAEQADLVFKTNFSSELKGLKDQTSPSVLLARSSYTKLKLNNALLAKIFNSWTSTIGVESPKPISSNSVHQYRRFLARMAPNLIPSKDGRVSEDMSPAEFFYVLDVLLARGDLPSFDFSPNPSESEANTQAKAKTLSRSEAYLAAKHAYFAKTTKMKQQQDFAGIVGSAIGIGQTTR